MVKKAGVINIRLSAIAGNCSGFVMHIFVLSACILIFSACNTLKIESIEKPSCFIPFLKQNLTDVEIQNLVNALTHNNSRLSSYKGIGEIRMLEHGKPIITSRMAWIGTNKGSIRIVILVAGRPAVNVACDGQWFYYQDTGSGNHAVKRKKYSKHASLEQMIKIPVRLDHMIAFLTGRIPDIEYDSVACEFLEENNLVVLVLKKWYGVAEKIYMDGKLDNVYAVEMYAADGSILYRMTFEKMQQINGYRVPDKLFISGADAIELRINIDRYFVDVAVKKEMFMLE